MSAVLKRISDLCAPRFSVVGSIDLKTNIYNRLDVPANERVLVRTQTHTVVMLESYYGFRRKVHVIQDRYASVRGIPIYGHIETWRLGGPWPAGVNRSDQPKRTAKLLVFEGGKSPNNAA